MSNIDVGRKSSGSLSSDSSGQLHVLWHDGDSLGVDGAEVGVFEKSNHVGLSSLLESEDSRRLESEVVLEVVGDFSNESLEWKFSNEELSRLLELSDVSEGNSSWSESVWSLDSSWLGWGFSLVGGFGGGHVLSWLLGSSSFSSGVLCSCHLVVF